MNNGKLIVKLAATPVDELVPEAPKPGGSGGIDYWKGIVTLSENDSVRNGMERLESHNFLSAPLRTGVTGKDDSHYNYGGFVDMLDLLSFVMSALGEKRPATMDEVRDRVREAQDAFDNTTLKAFAGVKRRSTAYFPLPEGCSLYPVAELLAWSGTHRVPIVKHNSKISNVITQSMMLRYLLNEIPDALGDLANMPVSNVDGSKDFETVTAGASAYDVCQLMASKSLDNVAIVSEDGTLEQNFSVKDLRGLGLDGSHMWRLFLSVDKYKKEQALNEPKYGPRKLVVAKDNDTLRDLLKKFVEDKVHHVWVCTEDGKPSRCITPSHVLQALFKKESD